MHVNSHEVTTNEISGVHRGIFRKLSDLVSISIPRVAVCSLHKNCTMYAETNAVSVSARNEATVHYVLVNLRA